MKRSFAIAFLSIALFSSRSTESAPAPMARPALWKIVDADTTIYLFGTIHLLPKSLAWQTPRIDQAIRASQGLVLETVLSDPKQTGAVMAKLGVSPDLPPVLDRVPANKRAALQRVITKSGIPIAELDKFETWAVTLTLAVAGLHDLPIQPEYGAEAILSKRFRSDAKPISGLETVTEQLGYFDALPESAQRKFLVSVAEDDTDAKKQLDAMIAAWGAGNIKKIALTFDDELQLSPELTEALLRQRNRNWVKWITARMAKPGTVFVAVGAGHLAGKGSVNALLKSRGVRVQRIQ